MQNCPQCHIKLEHINQNDITFFLCPSCKGILSSVYALKKYIPSYEIKLAWADIASAKKSKTNCPSCQNNMSKILASSYAPFCLCANCQTAWFTKQEKLLLPDLFQRASSQKKLDTLTSKERVELAVSLAESAKAIHSPLSPAPTLTQALFSMVGLPIPKKGFPPLQEAHTTRIILYLMFSISIFYLYFKSDQSLDYFKFTGWGFFQHFGINFILSFFAHGSLWHLVSNAHFLRTFGPSIEERIGKTKFVLLLFCSHLVGNILFSFSNINVPTLGASGGVMGILTLYGLSFPKEKIGLFFITPLVSFTRWFWIPVWGALILLFFQNLIESSFQSEFTKINYLCHLGGITTGVGFWVYLRKKFIPF